MPGSLKVFRGPQGIRVALVRLQDGTYLVRVTGTSHEMDAKVVRARVRRDGLSAKWWRTRVDGGEVGLLLRLVSRRQGAPRYYLNLPYDARMQRLPLQFHAQDTERTDASALRAAHQRQLAAGVLAELARFHVRRRMAEIERSVRRRLRFLNRKCEARFTFHLAWDTVRSRTRRGMRGIARFCAEPLDQIAAFCQKPGVRPVLRSALREVHCGIGDGLRATLRAGVLTVTGDPEMRRRSARVRRILGERIRWGPQGKTLARVIFENRVFLCANDRGVHVGLVPKGDPDRLERPWARRLLYGTRRALYWGQVHRGRWEGTFFDPRYVYGRRGGVAGRGRHFSQLRVDPRKGTCVLRCGAHTETFRRVPVPKALAILRSRPPRPPVRGRQPYGLARDRRGTYYYVDRAPGEEKRDFRLYRGPMGRMRRLRMINVVSDSKGDVFSTRDGRLRLVLEREHSFWIRGRRRERLINVPIDQNLPLIYNDLGVYVGVPVGSPCDVL